MSPRSCCILLFTLQKACNTRIVCLFPRSVVSCCLPCRRLVTRVACVVPREAFVHSCKCCFCCFPSSAGDKGEGEVARGLSYRMANFLYRRRGRVARGKPWGFALPLTQGGWQGQRLAADVAARAVATSRRSVACLGREACRPAPWVSRPACRRPWWPF